MYQKHFNTCGVCWNNGLMPRLCTMLISLHECLFLVVWCNLPKWRGATQVNRAYQNT